MRDYIIQLLGWGIVFGSTTCAGSLLGYGLGRVRPFRPRLHTPDAGSAVWSGRLGLLGFFCPLFYLWGLLFLWAFETIR